ncbi:GTP1/OBG subdomain-containing protein [Microstroma glucosiphilum]|uniref:GTP1/OBG subdomain-containing protein n=1 Tax=Pseudomicrostroma glucosiphilum TaxID=1684307 RepID=A0A316U5Q8_9BASI|nr:GTP1/OBG subdomain-containing protein [Pseudomicrostroma glucosiphilum]PWN20174.1 GTP1/OBG subdomain-containing protein [Pseudomicrostroma glucosiphilum]
MLRSLPGHGYRYALTPTRSTSASRLLGPTRTASNCNAHCQPRAVIRSLHTTSPCYSSDIDEQPHEKKKAATKAHFFRNAKSTSFLDILSVSGTAGSGGDGCVSFARAKYVEYGPPSGGSGGPGGSIYIRAVPSLRSLARVPSRIQAGEGGLGKGEWRDGRRGRDVTLQVPVGTVVKVWSRGVSMEEGEAGAMAERREIYEGQLLKRLGRGKRLKRLKGVQMPGDPEPDQEVDEAAEESAEEEDHFEDATPASRTQRDYVQEEEESLERRQMLNSVWRHYPGQGGAVEGLGADSKDEENLYSREEFRLAEERYAIALRKERAERAKEQADDLSGGIDSASEDSSLDSDDAQPIFTLDLSTPTPASSMGHLLASGGTAGFGNPYFLTGSNRSPKFATRGRQGEFISLTLELKTPADIGFIGLPNAGKSSLLRALTGATRKSAQVGGWEFTTLSPNVGVMRMSGAAGEARTLIGTGSEPILDSRVEDLPASAEEEYGRRFSSSILEGEDGNESQYVLSDLPGLILGASSNRGLGHQFLRHAERCLALLYVVDVSPSRPNPWEDLMVLKRELEGYKEGLSTKIRGVVANKCDVLGPSQSQSHDDAAAGEEPQRLTVDEAREKLRYLQQRVREDHGQDLKVFPVSAMWRQGVQGLAAQIETTIREEKRKEEEKKERETRGL